MVINVSVQYNGGFLLRIILYFSVDPMRLKSGNPFNTMKSFRPYNQCSHLNKSFVSDNFSPEGGGSESYHRGLERDVFRFLFKWKIQTNKNKNKQKQKKKKQDQFIN